MPSELDTCGQKRAGPPTWSRGTWAKNHRPTPQHKAELAAKDPANLPAARACIRPPDAAIVSPVDVAGNARPGQLQQPGPPLPVGRTSNSVQAAGTGATRAEGAAAPRQKVIAIANDTRSWPSMKTRNRRPGNKAPTATTESWFATE